MTNNDVKEKVLKILEDNKIGTLATVKSNKPHTRYMTFFNDELKLYTATSKETDKTEEIEENPNVHILIGYDGEGLGDAYLEIEGRASVNASEELKEKVWNDHLKPWFDGPNDPNYIVLEIQPTDVRVMNSKDSSFETLEL
ncbi:MULTISPECIES: pyridoxamine 5'-phosphate oxidase family protein [Bacillus]|uniref:General stress protein n=1 Tax=Bacillus infantis TaxID=324767 RepID=A0A5D4SHG4_9BACI|nr:MULTISPECIES: pyridoxamine 5'-phosphate oxidase family protein [Bacillus]OXT17285.1 general stress protein [Bacillus sp. OG2]MCA1034375.1 pyridoxamine 5'-phosphate oxidase family protein [Bacillus infantis]MCK6204178.1 pyridoxamine 5'-phosphate oxidase family protein [Bacillus infantis]PLR71631.1 general stress protein [Bacillus sp. UMB0728]RYI32424.1 general stress protein [Bacillus infantis]